MQCTGIHNSIRGSLAAAAIVAAGSVSLAEQPVLVADPTTFDDGTLAPRCCGGPMPGEVSADQVFGRWFVSRAPAGQALRAGDRVEFRGDGALATAHGVCRFAVLRAELTVGCDDGAVSGDVRFDGDDKLIWRHAGGETVFVAPAD